MSQDEQEYSGKDLQEVLDKLIQMPEDQVEAIDPRLIGVRRDAKNNPGLAQYQLITNFDGVIPRILNC